MGWTAPSQVWPFCLCRMLAICARNLLRSKYRWLLYNSTRFSVVLYYWFRYLRSNRMAFCSWLNNDNLYTRATAAGSRWSRRYGQRQLHWSPWRISVSVLFKVGKRERLSFPQIAIQDARQLAELNRRRFRRGRLSMGFVRFRSWLQELPASFGRKP